MTSKQLNIVLGIIITVLAGMVAYFSTRQTNTPTTYSECVHAGGTIQESYPATCRYKKVFFTQQISTPVQIQETPASENVGESMSKGYTK